MEIKLFNNEEFRTFREQHFPRYVWNDSPTFDGFDVFNFNTVSFSNYEHFFIVAFGEQEILGIMKVSRVTLIQSDNNLWSVSWIEVHKSYRRQGIATKLYERLNIHVTSDMVLISTGLLHDGRMANIQDLRKKMITNCKVFSDLEEYFKEKMQYLT